METSNLNLQVENLGQGLLKYIHSLNLDNEEQDLVQQTFLNAILKNPAKKKDEYLKTWADTMHKKAFINRYRHVLMQRPAVNTDNLCFIYKTDSDSDQNPDVIYNMIVGKIESLDKKLIKPFRMYVEGFSYKEIADEIKLKTATVKSRIFNARCQLIVQE